MLPSTCSSSAPASCAVFSDITARRGPALSRIASTNIGYRSRSGSYFYKTAWRPAFSCAKFYQSDKMIRLSEHAATSGPIEKHTAQYEVWVHHEHVLFWVHWCWSAIDMTRPADGGRRGMSLYMQSMGICSHCCCYILQYLKSV